MKYLLDTNACIAILNGRPAAVRTRLEWEFGRRASIHVPSVAVYELWFGVAKSRDAEASRGSLLDFLSAGVEVASFDADDAAAAGRLRAALEQSGRPIGPYDTLIAGQAIARDLILVTANHREFARIRGLRWEDWGHGA